MVAQSMWLNTFDSMLDKAERELDRMRASEEEFLHTDAAMNCALTVWHVADRLWADIDAWRARVPEAGAWSRECARDRGAFHNWLQRTEPALKMCRDVCDGAKHVVLDRPSAPNMRTAVSAANPEHDTDGRPFIKMLDGRRFIFKVKFGNDSHSIEVEKILGDGIAAWKRVRAQLFGP